MIVEMKGNESLIDQIENATLNVSSIQKAKSGQDSSRDAEPSLSLTHKSKAPDAMRNQLSIDLSNELTGHESRPSADYKYANDSKTAAVLVVDKCWMEGKISCKEGHLTCSGFGEIDCRAGECITSPTLICNKDLAKAKCSGHGSCKKSLASGEVNTAASLGFMETAIVVVTITLGVLVLVGTTIYVYIS